MGTKFSLLLMFLNLRVQALTTINLFRNVQVCVDSNDIHCFHKRAPHSCQFNNLFMVHDAKNAEDFSKTLQKRGVRSKLLREKLSAIKWK